MLMNTLRHLALILGVAFLAAVPVWSQVEPGAAGGAMPEEDDARMNVPPLLAGTLYANAAGAEAPRMFSPPRQQ